MKNKLISAVAALVIMAAQNSAVTADFEDVSSDAWYSEAVQYASDRGLMKGVSSVNFSPEDEITRAMLASVIYRMQGQPDPYTESDFADIDPSAYYYNAVRWGNENNIISGYSENEFAPDEKITREQLITMFHRYAGYNGFDTESGGDVSFSDISSFSDYAVYPVRWGVSAGVINGYEDNTFRPREYVTRAQAAALMLQFDRAYSIERELAPLSKGVIVIDPGHGKSSGAMSDEEKTSSGYVYRNGSWGEWRHFKDGTFGHDCEGEGCTYTAPSSGSCWYRMGNGDRDTEPEINLANSLAAKKYLEDMGYEVRMTRTSNEENPSMNTRVSYCFPDNDISQAPDADLYICVHSNAGGGRGTSYIALEDEYRQAYIPMDFKEQSNKAGEIINRHVAADSGLREGYPIGSEGWLILFNKCPVPIAYLEIGFYDNYTDLAILQSSDDVIGKAIADGAEEYLMSR